MDNSKVKFPWASTMAYKQNGSAEDASTEPKQEEPGQPMDTDNSQQNIELPSVLEALQAVSQRDVNGVLNNPPEGATVVTLSSLIAACQADSAPDRNLLAQQFRSLCDASLWSTFSGGDRNTAQQVSTLLDVFNDIMEPQNPKDSLKGAAIKPEANGAPAPSAANGTAGPTPEEEVPVTDDSFFLPASAPEVQQYLTITVDPGSLKSNAPLPPTMTTDKPRRQAAVKAAAANASGINRVKRIPRFPAPSIWTLPVQQQLATVLRMALKQGSDPVEPNPEELKETLDPLMMNLLEQLSEMQVCEQMRSMEATFENVLGALQAGSYVELEDFSDALSVDAHSAAEAYLEKTVDIRRGKILGAAESFTTLVTACVDNIMSELRAAAKAARVAEAAARGITEDELLMEMAGYDPNAEPEVLEEAPRYKLPPGILNNREPYRHGDWRKIPFAPRPYVRLQQYDIVEENTRELIERKLSTKKKGGCHGGHCNTRQALGTYSLEHDGFQTECSCLARNTECDTSCACHSQNTCLNRAVTARETVKMDEDVCEINSWGMDCYTRRNIQDAVLESQAFGPYKLPDYKAAVAAATPHAATAAGQHAAVAAGGSPSGGHPLSLSSPKPSGGSIGAAGAGSVNVAGHSGDGEAQPVHQLTFKEQQAVVERSVVEWIERRLIPSINRQSNDGWDIIKACADVKLRSEADGDEQSIKAAEAVEARVHQVGYNYFRIHPKGVGLVCKRPGGLPRLTFVEEYLGEIHTPVRWFELQDAVKKITGDELPDFYNILLERPKDDEDGYDVLFVDAAAKGAFASRMSHSCTPNCQAVVMACGGRLTIALYTLRQVFEGEELTFDYSSVTESEKEFREAICLCGTAMCRGSYLYYTGSRAFQQVMNAKHNMLHRQAILARAGAESLVQADLDRIKAHGLGDSALGSVAHGDRAPDWLIKWTALICEYLETEEACLKQELLAQPNSIYTEITAGAEAKGVIANRLQNVVITLDKVKMFLRHPGQPQGPPLRPLTDSEVVDHLWGGIKSVAKKLMKGATGLLWVHTSTRNIVGARTEAELEAAVASAMEKADELPAQLKRILEFVMQPAVDAADARKKLFELVEILREVDNERGGGLTAAADCVYLYASTKHWLTAEKYVGMTAPPVPINLKDLFLNRAQETATEEEQEKMAAKQAKANKKNPALKKTYRAAYPWGQLSGWFKQTVNDPTASLSAERRGTLSLPDVESAFSGKGRYGGKERNEMMEHIERRPDGMWRVGSIWSFRNEAKVYGSPMLDAAWMELTQEQPSPLPEVIRVMRSAAVPPAFYQTAPQRGTSGGSRGGKGKGKARGAGGGSRSGRGKKRKNGDDDLVFDEFGFVIGGPDELMEFLE